MNETRVPQTRSIELPNGVELVLRIWPEYCRIGTCRANRWVLGPSPIGVTRLFSDHVSLPAGWDGQFRSEFDAIEFVLSATAA